MYSAPLHFRIPRVSQNSPPAERPPCSTLERPRAAQPRSPRSRPVEKTKKIAGNTMINGPQNELSGSFRARRAHTAHYLVTPCRPLCIPPALPPAGARRQPLKRLQSSESHPDPAASHVLNAFNSLLLSASQRIFYSAKRTHFNRSAQPQATERGLHVPFTARTPGVSHFDVSTF